jgi:hypothetical protein
MPELTNKTPKKLGSTPRGRWRRAGRVAITAIPASKLGSLPFCYGNAETGNYIRTPLECYHPVEGPQQGRAADWRNCVVTGALSHYPLFPMRR